VEKLTIHWGSTTETSLVKKLHRRARHFPHGMAIVQATVVTTACRIFSTRPFLPRCASTFLVLIHCTNDSPYSYEASLTSRHSCSCQPRDAHVRRPSSASHYPSCGGGTRLPQPPPRPLVTSPSPSPSRAVRARAAPHALHAMLARATLALAYSGRTPMRDRNVRAMRARSPRDPPSKAAGASAGAPPANRLPHRRRPAPAPIPRFFPSSVFLHRLSRRSFLQHYPSA